MKNKFAKKLISNSIQKLLFALFLGVTLNTSVQSQSNVRLMGQIYDDLTGSPLAGAVIQVNGTCWGATSNEDGSFVLENISPGKYDISISLLGYRSVRLKAVQITEDSPKKIQAAMHSQPLPGDSVLVTATALFEETGIEGDKIIITKKDLKR